MKMRTLRRDKKQLWLHYTVTDVRSRYDESISVELTHFMS